MNSQYVFLKTSNNCRQGRLAEVVWKFIQSKFVKVGLIMMYSKKYHIPQLLPQHTALPNQYSPVPTQYRII